MLLSSLKHLYQNQKSTAKRRGIEFLLSFEEWHSIWQTSGRLAKRGRKKGQYVMARFGDMGSYSISNVQIVLCEQNHRDAALAMQGIPKTNECKEKLRQIRLGSFHTEETKAKIGRAQKGIPKGPMKDSTKDKLRLAHLGKKMPPISEEHKKKLSEAKKKYWQQHPERKAILIAWHKAWRQNSKGA